MKIITDISGFNPKPSAITIGTFDGLHLGHQAVLNQLVQDAKSMNFLPTLLTFHPHPRVVLGKVDGLKFITTLEEKSLGVKKCGIAQLVIYPFSRELANMSPEDYVRDILVKKLNVKFVMVGHDHKFGKDRVADIEDLKKMGKKYNFEVQEVQAKRINQVVISSTIIRNEILRGNILNANKYLGNNFSITGKVVKGKGRGKTIGFPTANINIENPFKIIPKDGVYAVKSKIGSRSLKGMMNIGFNPTFNNLKQTLEVHWFDFHDNIYGKELTIELLGRIRDEKKFNSIDSLTKQLTKDRVQISEILDA